MTKKQKVISIIAFVLIIVLIALICVSLQGKKNTGGDEPKTSTEPVESTEPTPEPTPTPLQFTAAPEGYFNDALFIGDSRMVGIEMMQTIDGATFFTTVGLSLTGAMSTSADVAGVGTTTLPALLQSRQFGKVYVMLGINDIGGSVEALKQSLLKLSNDEVVVKIIHGGVGAINESDVILASASNAIIIGFNVRPDATAKEIAEREGVDLRLYRVIYNAIEDVEAAMKGMLDPVFEEKVLGHAEVRQTFKASGVGTIAGAYVLDGIFERNCSVRLIRDGIVVFDGPLASLKRFKDDVKEVRTGYECGFVFENYNDIKEGDQVEAYKMVETERK